MGVSFNGPVEYQRIAGNQTGIAAVAGQLIAHNLIYENAQGVHVEGDTGVRIVQNTFYTAVGDNVRIDGGSGDTELWHNIFWTLDGYELLEETPK